MLLPSSCFRRVILALATLATGAGLRAAKPASQPPATALRMMSFNVRTSGAQDGENVWPIDFIFHSPHFRATTSEIVRAVSPQGRYPSDHYPVTAVLMLNEPGS